MSLKELKLIFPKISDAPKPSDRDAYFLFALAALWRDLSGEERQEWWSVLEKEERLDFLRLLGGLRLQRSFRCNALKLFYSSTWYTSRALQPSSVPSSVPSSETTVKKKNKKRKRRWRGASLSIYCCCDRTGQDTTADTTLEPLF